MTEQELGIGLYKIKIALTGQGLWGFFKEFIARRKDNEKETCIITPEGSEADFARGRFQANDSLLSEIEQLIESALIPSEQAENKEESDVE